MCEQNIQNKKTLTPDMKQRERRGGIKKKNKKVIKGKKSTTMILIRLFCISVYFALK